MLVYRSLQLLQELVDILEVGLGAQVRQRQRIVIGERNVRRGRNRRASSIFRGSDTIGQIVKVHQALAHGFINAWVQVTRLEISKEFIQSIECSLLSKFVLGV
jgi:hypothetical protein